MCGVQGEHRVAFGPIKNTSGAEQGELRVALGPTKNTSGADQGELRVALGPINGTSEADARRLPTLKRHRGARLPRPRRDQRRRSAEVDTATGGTS